MAMYTGCDSTHSSSILRRNKDSTRESVACPKALQMYNKSMGGVGLGDLLRCYYNVRMNCRKVHK